MDSAMVRSGWAMDYERYSKGTYAAAADAQAGRVPSWLDPNDPQNISPKQAGDEAIARIEQILSE